MSRKRKIEIFSAGCAVCDETVEMVKGLACPSCEVTTLDMREAEVARRAKEFGIRSIPTVMVDRQLASCCEGRGSDDDTLKAAGIGKPI